MKIKSKSWLKEKDTSKMIFVLKLICIESLISSLICSVS